MKKNIYLYIYVCVALLCAALPTAASADQGDGIVRHQKLKGAVAGNSFVVSWRLVLDSLHLASNRQMVFTPVLEDANGNVATLRSVMVNGRNQHYVFLRNGSKNYPDAIELRRVNGQKQTYEYREAIPSEPWMADATLRINEDTCGCGNLFGTHPGTPVDVNPHLERRVSLAFMPTVAAPDPVFTLHGRAYLDFPVNRTELYPDYHNNPAELHKIMSTIDTVRNNPNVRITHIGIHGYASPEGSYENNIRLSKGRAATLKEYVRRQYDFPADIYTVQHTPEDWAGLDSFLVSSNLPEKDDILKIVRSDMEPDPKNEYIKKTWPEAYRFIWATWYPYLRHSDYEVSYQVRPMSDEEAAEVLKKDPRLLSLNKMYRVANLYPVGSDDYNRVLETAAAVYPDDPVANVNIAAVALRAGELARAEVYLAHAGNSAEALNARGVLQLLKGNADEARRLFQEAGSKEANDNLRLMKEMDN